MEMNEFKFWQILVLNFLSYLGLFDLHSNFWQAV